MPVTFLKLTLLALVALSMSCEGCAAARACVESADCPAGTACSAGSCVVALDAGEGEGELVVVEGEEGEGEVVVGVRLVERGFAPLHVRRTLQGSDRVIVDESFEVLPRVCAGARCVSGGFSR